MSVKTAIPLPLEELAAFCRRHGIVRLEVFGSILREDFGPESDVDIIYTMAPGAPRLKSHWLRLEIQDELEALLGREVDLMSAVEALAIRNPHRRQRILSSAEVLLELTPPR